MLYTSYFAQLKNLPKDIVPISICGRAPDWYDGLQYKQLAPKYGFFMEWKRNRDNDFYIKHFNEEVLNQLNVNNVIITYKDRLSRVGFNLFKKFGTNIIIMSEVGSEKLDL